MGGLKCIPPSARGNDPWHKVVVHNAYGLRKMLLSEICLSRNRPSSGNLFRDLHADVRPIASVMMATASAGSGGDGRLIRPAVGLALALQEPHRVLLSSLAALQDASFGRSSTDAGR